MSLGGPSVFRINQINEIERRKREREGISIEDETWSRITEVAEELVVPVPEGDRMY